MMGAMYGRNMYSNLAVNKYILFLTEAIPLCINNLYNVLYTINNVNTAI